MDRLVKGGERAGEDTLQTGHRWDSNLDQQKQVHGVLTTTPNQHPIYAYFLTCALLNLSALLRDLTFIIHHPTLPNLA